MLLLSKTATVSTTPLVAPRRVREIAVRRAAALSLKVSHVTHRSPHPRII